MKSFRQYITEAKLEPGGEDIGKLFGPKGRFSPKARNVPKEPTYNARVKSGELSPPAPKKLKKKPAAKRQAGIFPPVTNNLAHHSVTMRRWMKIKDGGRILRTLMSEYTPGFMKHSDALTSSLHEYHKSTGGRASEFERALHAHNVVSSHLHAVSKQVRGLKTLPIHKKFGRATISDITHERIDGDHALRIHFKPLKSHVSTTSEIKKLTDHLKKHTGHAWYIHPDSGTYMVGTKHSPLVLATSINHPWLRGDDGGGGGGNEPETPKPNNPKGKQPTGPVAPTRPRTPALV